MRVLLFGFLVVAMVAVGCSGDDDDAATPTTMATSATTVTPAATVTEATTTSTSVQEVEVSTTTAPPAEVIEGAFTFADDDLCGWVSAEKVAEFVATEFDDPDVTAVQASGKGEDWDSGCAWYFVASSAPDEFGSVRAFDAGSTWKDYSGGNHEFAELGMVEHPSLSDGVVVLDRWDTYTFWVPPAGEYLDVYVSFPREEGDYWDADYQARVFRVADRFVQELGWLG